MYRKSLYLTLIIIVGFCGCATTVTDVMIKPKVDLPQNVPQVQLSVGVYESPKFRDYEQITSQYRFPVGQASASLFQELFPKAFKKTVWVENLPPITTTEQELSAVIEPQIDEFQVFWLLVGNAYKAWAEIHYRFNVYTPDGAMLASWTVEGVGESSGFVSAVNYAMQEAAWRFITSLNDIPEAKRWLRGLPQQEAITAESEQTTRPDPQFAEGAVLGIYPGIVTVSADANSKPEGQSAEVNARFKAAGLLAIRVQVKNQSSHRLLLRRRNISLVRPDGTEISSLPASIFAALGVNPRMKGWTAPSGVGVGALPLVFVSLVNVAAMGAEDKELETHLSIYQDKELYDATLTRGRSVQGYVYFFVPEEVVSLEDLKLVLPIIDFDSATWYIIKIPISLP